MKVKIRNIGLLALLVPIAVFAGCGGGSSDVGSSVIPPPAVTQGAASLSGKIYMPAGGAGSRVAGRGAAVSATGKDTPVAGAQVSVYRINSDGTPESLGSQYTATTDPEGNYTIPWVPMEENVVIMAEKQVNVDGTPRTLRLRKLTSVTDTQVGGTVTGLDIDAGSTISAAAMRNILIQINQRRPEGQKIRGGQLPREILAQIHTDVVEALAADQTGSNPAVNLMACVTDGDNAPGQQLSNLANSSNGITLRTRMEQASTTSSLRVHVAEGTTDGSPLKDAVVVVTIDDAVWKRTTNEYGNAFIEGISIGKNSVIQAFLKGYSMGSVNQAVDSQPGTVTTVTVVMNKAQTNQAPVAIAGSDQRVTINSLVTLSGADSFDPDGDTMTYTWAQTQGPTTALSSNNTATTTFTPSAPATYTFSLTVNDGRLNSEPDVVNVTAVVPACYKDPDCNDGNALTLDACSNPGTIDASCGHTAIACNQDSDCSNPTPYCLNGGTGMALCISCKSDSNCNDGNAYTEDICTNGNTAQAACTHAAIRCLSDTDCDDGNENTLNSCTNPGASSSSCEVTDIAPTANAGTDQTVSIGDDVTLSGAGSSDPDGDTLTYSWEQTAGPTVQLSTTSGVSTTFSPGVTGTYIFKLTVNDGHFSRADTVSVTAQSIQSGDFLIDTYYKSKAYNGTTLFFDTLNTYRLLQVNMRGEIVWTYTIPTAYLQTQTIGLDVEKLANGNYLFFTGTGIYEINSAGAIQWSYATNKISHDVQRLPNGDTLFNFGNNDAYADAQMRRVNSAGSVVWSWYAKDHIPNDGISDQGWTHANAVIWQSADSIFINLRNQYKTLEADSSGNIIWGMDWSVFGSDVDPHEPDILSSGNMLMCLQNDSPYVAVEINRSTKQSVWTYANTSLRTARDCDRLPNGNTLIVAVDTGGTTDVFTDDYSTMIEVTSSGEIVWRMTANTKAVGLAPGYFYKAERLYTGWTPSATAD
ncbi:MAG: PKD domain-containing protein [bacterium]